jgi:hypothetical protein
MNTSLDGTINFHEFQTFCSEHPEAINFIGRVTMGPTPASDQMQAKVV